MAKGDDLVRRLTTFAVRVITLSEALPKSAAGQNVARQVLRCGTAAGANYEEARGAESRADFVHKMGVVLKELKETRYWLAVTAEAKLVSGQRLDGLQEECEELCAIMGKSVFTAKKKGDEH